MYLSARAISQSATTRAFLSGIRQDGKSLPDGPIVISPDGMIPSLYREGKPLRLFFLSRSFLEGSTEFGLVRCLVNWGLLGLFAQAACG